MTAPRLAPVLVVTPIKELCHPGQQAERHELRIVQVVEFAEEETLREGARPPDNAGNASSLVSSALLNPTAAAAPLHPTEEEP